MITYNPKDWFSFIFRFHKADTVRKLLPVIIGIAVYSFVIAFIEIEYLKLAEDSRLSNITVMHTTLGFVISMLLVFRINSAYDRWYEGRKQWGALVNSSRNFSLKLKAMVAGRDDLAYFQVLVVNYAYALKNHLRDVFVLK